MIKALVKKCSCLTLVVSLAAVLVAPQNVLAQGMDDDLNDPSALAMTGDLVVARPLLLTMTVVGTAAYIVSLPFSLAGGNAKQAGETLVVGPAKATFVRCLGCTRSGYRKEP